jgi:hypothetical protein
MRSSSKNMSYGAKLLGMLLPSFDVDAAKGGIRLGIQID